MKLTDREIALLMQGVSLIVQVAEVGDSGKKLTIKDLTRYQEAVEFLNRVVGRDPTVNISELDRLFNKIIEYGQQEREPEVNGPEPEQPYCQFLH